MAKVPSILPSIIDEAVRKEAADIIFSYNCPPILKVNEKLIRLEQYGTLSEADINGTVQQILPPGKVEEFSQNKQTDFAYASGPNRFRVNVFSQRGKLSLVMRYVRDKIKTIDELGLPEVVKELVENDNGLILMVGPTGSGKSTSLAAMLQHLNENFEKHIITIEDPVEYVYENKQSVIEQREVGIDTKSFPDALRAALREAPDVILLGEMRDLESISTAITVAETGHLVMSTIHANSAYSTVDRIIDIFPPGQKDQVRIQLADILLAVLNQRLVPRADGNGSKLIVEVMLATSAVRNAIRTANNAQLPNIIQTGASDGMFLLDDLLAKAVHKGEITKEMAMAYAADRNELRKNL